MPAAAPTSRSSRTGPLSIWLMNAAMAALAGSLYAWRGHDATPLAQPHISWWILAVGFVAAERCVVHLHFQREAHSFSLGDIPLVFGLIFARPSDLLLATILGSFVVFALDRRLPPIKVAFNVAQYALATTAAVIVVHALVDPATHITPAIGGSVMLAAELCALASVALISIAISLAESRVALPRLGEMFGMDLAVTVTNTAIGTLAAVVLVDEPWALALILIPVSTVYVVYRAYMQARQRHDRLEFLYEANRTLSQSQEASEALDALLRQSLDAFRAESAELALLGGDEGPVRTTIWADGASEHLKAFDPLVAQRLHEWTREGGIVRAVAGATGDAVLDAYLSERGISHALISVLGSDERVIGTLMLANRFGVVRSFDADDLNLFETLAGNASVALQNDRLEQAVEELNALQAQLQHQAFHDPLTELPNRALFQLEVQRALAARPAETAVMFIDVDDFKTVNDSLGHAVGDELLRGVARRLRECLRQDDLVARLGGDEFAVLVVERGGAERMATVLSQRMMDAFRLPIAAGQELVSVHLSVGIAIGGDATGLPDDLIRNADVAMYQAKMGGKGRFELFDPRAGAAMLHRHSLKSELVKALEREELEVHYQPIVALDSGEVVAAEALLRWNHPLRGLVAPGEFIALAEETGLIVQIGRHVLDRACAQAAAWRAQRHDEAGIAVHVNLSAVELADEELLGRVRATLQRHGLPPSDLVLEITESRLLVHADSLARLTALRGLGIRLALDDFGTGYSSLSYLQDLPLDILKIPKPFIDRLADDDVFVRTICDLAEALDLEVIAEGIETAEQLKALTALESSRGQGFFLARPSLADAVVLGDVLPAASE